jgi:HEAT repeat protein
MFPYALHRKKNVALKVADGPLATTQLPHEKGLTMKSANHWLPAASVFLLAVLMVPARGEDKKPTPAKAASESEADQIKRIAARLDRIAPGMINGITFTMIHCGGDIDAFVKAVGSPDAHGKGFSFAAAVRDAGGLAKYRRRAAGLLTSRDPVTRGYGAQWLGIVGDDSCKADLARLLKGTSIFASLDGLAGFDCEMAAMSLGMLHASEYAKDLAALLRDRNGRVRAGAATALGLLRAKEYADAIAKSLDYKSGRDPRAEEAEAGAILALVALDAKQHAPEIAKRIKPFSDAAELAMFAIVALDAKEQKKDLAAWLKDDFMCGDAAVALALMGATEYADAIDGLLKKKEDHFARCKAAIALGILRAEIFAPDLADMIKSTTDYERTTAAWALVLLEDKEHAAVALKIIGPKGEKTFFSAWVPKRGSMVIADQLDKLGERAMKSLKKLRGEVAKEETRPQAEKQSPKPAPTPSGR